MKISAKGRYAVETMVDIAKNGDNFSSVSEIAARQNISVKYLEQIISCLVKAKLVVSLRGANGGYILSKKPDQCSIAEILSATGDMPKLAPCLVSSSSCPKKNSCEAIGCWETLNSLIFNYLSNLTLQNLIDKSYKNNF